MHPTDQLTARISPLIFDAVNLATRKALARLIDEHGRIEIGTHRSKARGLHLDPKLILEPKSEADRQLLTALGLDPQPVTTLWLKDAETVLTRVHALLTNNYDQAAVLLAAIALKHQIRVTSDPAQKENLTTRVLKLRNDLQAMNAEGAET